MKRTALTLALILVLFLSAIVGTRIINLADANPNWIDFSAPAINILSPINQKYNVTDIPLNFTVSERVLKVTYSLDGQAKVTINGNANLTGLSSGSHNLTVYATDLSGNTGTSETVYFTIAEEPKPEPLPAPFIVAPIVAVSIAILGLLIYLRKRRRQTEMLSLSETK